MSEQHIEALKIRLKVRRLTVRMIEGIDSILKRVERISKIWANVLVNL